MAPHKMLSSPSSAGTTSMRARDHAVICLRQLRSQRHEQAIARLGDPAANHDARRVQEHDGGLEPQRQIDHVAFYKCRIAQQLAGGTPMIAFQPQSAAHPLQATL